MSRIQQERVDQGLPPVIEDEATYVVIAALVQNARRPAEAA